MNMNQNDTSQKINNYVSYIVCIVSGIISLSLTILIIAIGIKYNSSNAQDGIMIAIGLGVIAPFAVFFGAVASRGLTLKMASQKELMPTKSWRILGLVVFLCGVIGSILGHWLAIMVPSSIAIIVLMKDRRVIEKLKSLGLLQ